MILLKLLTICCFSSPFLQTFYFFNVFLGSGNNTQCKFLIVKGLWKIMLKLKNKQTKNNYVFCLFFTLSIIHIKLTNVHFKRNDSQRLFSERCNILSSCHNILPTTLP